MDGPNPGFRELIGVRGLQARDRADEEELERVLEEIEDAIRTDLEQGPSSQAVSEEDAWDAVSQRPQEAANRAGAMIPSAERGRLRL